MSTESPVPGQAMVPVRFSGTPQGAQDAIRRALAAEPRTRITLDEPGYIRAESRSLFFRFVDDVELVVDARRRVIRFRSGARLGRRDFGVNRARMRRIGARLRADPAISG